MTLPANVDCIWILFQMKTDSILVVMVLCLVPVATAFFSLDDCESLCHYDVKHCFQNCFLQRCFQYCDDTFNECKETCVKRSKEDQDSSRKVAKWNKDQSWHNSWKLLGDKSTKWVMFIVFEFSVYVVEINATPFSLTVVVFSDS